MKNFLFSKIKKVKDKILWTIELIECIQKIPEKYLKHITGTADLYEIRVQSSGEIFRIFCFFDKKKVVVLANGYKKKSRRTPKKEIVKALKIKQEYEKEK